MSNKNTSGPAAKNRDAGAASELNIPKLGDQQPILQEGESADVLASSGPPAEPTSAAEESNFSMADIQAKADAAMAPSKAMNRPAFFRPEREQQAEVPLMSLEMPISGSLDAMRRPDQYVEPVTDLCNFKDKAEALAFLEEMMIIRIHETGDPSAEPVVELGINGRKVFIRRGEDVIVRRKYVEQLLRAKPESINTRYVRNGDGDVKNMIDKTRALKYPFSIIRDDNPKGRGWERKIRSEA